MLGPIESFSDYFVAGLLGLVSWAARLERTMRNHGDRLDAVERRQEGDDSDPNSVGVLKQVAELERDVEEIDAKLEQAREERQEEHAKVMDRLTEIEQEIHDS